MDLEFFTVRCLHSVPFDVPCFAKREPSAMNSLLDEAWRLEPFVPPFRFSAFFSPEDTLLCVCAADAARLQLAPADGQGAGRLRIAELTSGSGLVGLRLLCDDSRATLLGLDIDEQAVEVSELNAGALR